MPARTLWGFDATPIYRQFALDVALDVVHLWDPPPIVLRYLKTGDESIRARVGALAFDAAWGPIARPGAKDAAGAVERAAHEDAAVAAADTPSWARAAVVRATATTDPSVRLSLAKKQSRRLAALLIGGRRLYGQRHIP